MQRRVGITYLAIGSVVATGYFTVPGMRGNGLVFTLIPLSSAVAIGVGVVRNRPEQIRPWTLFLAAQVSFVIGDLLYYAFGFDFPSVGDLFYLAVYPLLVAGLLLLLRARAPGRDRAGMLDASVITVGLGLLAWVFLIGPYTHLGDLGLLERIVSIAYPLMDVLLLAVAARLAVGSGSRSASFYLIGIGIVSLLATDAVYGLIELHTGYDQGGLLDAGWLAYYLLWGTAALLPCMGRLGEPDPVPRSTLTSWRLVPLAAATLIAPAVGIVESLGGTGAGLSVSSLASAVLFLLVLARMIGLVGTLRRTVDDEQRAVFRESVLRRAAVALGGAPDSAAIEVVAADAARALTADLGTVDVAGARGIPSALPASLETLAAQVAVALERAALADDLLRQRSDARMAGLVQHASDVIALLDADLVVQYHTASAQLSLGYEAGSLTGTGFRALVHPDDLPIAERLFASLLRDPAVRPESELRLRRRDGTWLPVEAVGNNLLHDASLRGIVVTIRDVSKRKALEDGLVRQVRELEELDQIKTDLVCNVSHELRTPLTTMVGQIEMLAEGELGVLTDDQLWAVEAIGRNGARLQSLIEDMLILARIETGGFDLAIARTDLRELIDALETVFAPRAEARSIDVAFELVGVDVVFADRSQLERALENVLSNAVKFTPPGGTVRLRVAADDANVTFSVSDTGIGMSADDQEHLFTRFFRSPTAMSMAIQGTGLGLAIVKKIVDDHGGTISVESVPDVGTTVTFTIPLIPAAGPVVLAVAGQV